MAGVVHPRRRLDAGFQRGIQRQVDPAVHVVGVAQHRDPAAGFGDPDQLRQHPVCVDPLDDRAGKDHVHAVVVEGQLLGAALVKLHQVAHALAPGDFGGFPEEIPVDVHAGHRVLPFHFPGNPTAQDPSATPNFQHALAGLDIRRIDDAAHGGQVSGGASPPLQAGDHAQRGARHRNDGVSLAERLHHRVPLGGRGPQRQQNQRRPRTLDAEVDAVGLTVRSGRG